MLTRTLTLAACVLTASTAAEAQTLLNPLSWFNPPASYGSNCANGQCGPCPNGQCGPGYGSSNRPANCANGQCYQQPGYYSAGYNSGNCPGGVCPPTQGYYNTNYRPTNSVPYTQPVPYAAPVRYQPTDNFYYGPSANSPYRTQPTAPMVRTPQYQTPVNSVSNPRSFNQNNSPFYP